MCVQLKSRIAGQSCPDSAASHNSTQALPPESPDYLSLCPKSFFDDSYELVQVTRGLKGQVLWRVFANAASDSNNLPSCSRSIPSSSARLTSSPYVVEMLAKRVFGMCLAARHLVHCATSPMSVPPIVYRVIRICHPQRFADCNSLPPYLVTFLAYKIAYALAERQANWFRAAGSRSN